MGRLDQKVAVITGGTSGMGREIARLFATQGARLVVGGRDSERGDDVIREIRERGGEAEFVPGDVATTGANQDLVDRAVRCFGGIDVLVSCAGVLGLGSVTDVPVEVWESTIRTNLSGVFYLLRLGIPELQRRGGGAILVVGSILGFKGLPNHAAYCASKGALVPFVKQVAVDYGPAIRANLLCPGPVDTPLLWRSTVAFPEPEAAVDNAVGKTALKRLGRPRDVADAALFLCSDDSKWITGTSLTVDGGILAGG